MGNWSPNRARYFRSRSVSFAERFFLRDSLNSSRPASDSERTPAHTRSTSASCTRSKRSIAPAPGPSTRRRMSSASPCSIGVATLQDDEHPSVLLTRADIALYDAKGDGRDRVMTAAPSVRERAR